MGSTPAVLTADEKLSRINIKFERAKKHVTDLDAACNAFLATKPYVVGCKRDPETRKAIYYVHDVRPVPDEISTIAADAIHNLRVTLDHMARQLFLVGPDARQNIEFNFPFRQDAKQFKSFIDGAIKVLRKDAIEVLRDIEPYKRGKGHELWVLNRLDNIDKHRLLVTVGSSYGGVSINHIFERMMNDNLDKMWPGVTFPVLDPLFINPADKLCPLKAGDELFVDAVDAECSENFKFRFTVAFNEPGVVQAQPVMETLHNFGKLIAEICMLLKPCLA